MTAGNDSRNVLVNQWHYEGLGIFFIMQLIHGWWGWCLGLSTPYPL